MVEIYSYYRELGGKYITLGSDSHKIEHIGRNFEKLYKFLEETKLTPCYFKDRKLIPYVHIPYKKFKGFLFLLNHKRL